MREVEDTVRATVGAAPGAAGGRLTTTTTTRRHPASAPQHLLQRTEGCAARLRADDGGTVCQPQL